MADQRTQIEGVLKLMENMVSGDGGTIRINAYDPDASRLVVDYDKGPKGGCAECVLDEESLRDFIVEALETRGLAMGEVVVQT